MEIRLRNLDWLHSVWRISTVNPFAHNYDHVQNKIIERHLAPFPEELAHRLIELYSQKGDIVLDPFAGTGTTLVAAQKLGLSYLGIEIVSDYAEFASKQLEQRAT